MIPLILDAAAGKRPHITVYGDNYDTPDGTCIRDYSQVTGRSIPIKMGPRRDGDPPRLVGDASRIRNMPYVTSVERIDNAQILEDWAEALLDAADGEAWLHALKQGTE